MKLEKIFFAFKNWNINEITLDKITILLLNRIDIQCMNEGSDVSAIYYL